MSGLVEFLLARIAEAEKDAREASPGSWRADGGEVWTDSRTSARTSTVVVKFTWPQEARHIARWSQARVLAECEAKRRTVEALDYTPCPCQTAARCVIHDASAAAPQFARERYVDPVTESVLYALALPYVDHPDYREEWRP